MVNVVLFCFAGMSTSLLVNKMKKAAEEENISCTINAYGAGELEGKGNEADVILLGPQARFLLPKVKEQHPDKPIMVIDMQMYGMMKGKETLMQALELLK